MKKNQITNKAADNIRILIAAMVEKANSGHPGGSMGGADFINVLYSEFLIFDPNNPTWHWRDRFFLDPGHMSPMLYAVLTLSGFFSLDELKKFRQLNSHTPGHPELNVVRGIENTSGPLGQGHTYAVGAAIAAKFLQAKTNFSTSQKIYAYISDGGIQEEISQGAGRIAGHLRLNNLIMFYDSNDIQLSTKVESVTSEDTAMKYHSWGWNVIKINGNSAEEIRKSLQDAQKEKNQPTLIIGKTIMGKGVVKIDNSPFERNCATHGMPLSECGASFEATIKNLGGDPENPFKIFPEVIELYENRRKELVKIVNKQIKKESEWSKINSEKATKLRTWLYEKPPKINWETIRHKSGESTRSASSNILSFLAKKIENMIVSSADLSNSDKTDGFLKQTKAINSNDFSGSFLQVGVTELTMACLCIGMSLYGGVIPACGTFFVFSDYMKPAIRMAALMELPIKFIWTHDSFRVGEDGPTHEPVEQEAQIRLMEKLKNHNGNNSMLILRPADVHETTIAWKLAIENTTTPTGLIFSRQSIIDLPAKTNRYEEALQTEKGGYVVECDGDDIDIILIASGSEVSTLIEGAVLLRKDGIKVRIVSIPSEGLFRKQTSEYQNSVIIPGKKTFGLTAGLPIILLELVGIKGKVWGLESFGFSAPYKILDKKLGFTGENVYKQVKKML
ncbi:MAG: transketolase [Bacteroidales bacterium OttesenSCG-928-I14]|jgi:transketolase|nr:transketolase [Bacteroidales bacterium OttesenSCG-928-I14]